MSNNKTSNSPGTLAIQMIPDEKLLDYSGNIEDTSDTADIEQSIGEEGFFDPIDVTDFDSPEGMYTIVSGHRRRNAGRKKGINLFPCIVKTFSDPSEVQNYVFHSNSTRDSSKDPLLYLRRYKALESFYKTIGFKGNSRDEIALRLGLSIAQADRYKALGKIIEPILGLLQNEVVGMSSIQPVASLKKDEQSIVFNMMKECLDSGGELTRETVKWIVDNYKSGLTSYGDLSNHNDSEYVPNDLRDSGLPLYTYTNENTRPGQSGSGSSSSNRNNETRREFDPVAANADDADRFYQDNDNVSSANSDSGDLIDNALDSAICDSNVSKNIESPKIKKGSKILKLLSDICECSGCSWEFGNGDIAADALRNMANAIIDVIDEMRVISSSYNISDALEEALIDINNYSK